jgi:hypothetical protein
MHRRAWRSLPYAPAEAVGWRRLAAAVLWQGYAERDTAFVESEWARQLAAWLDLPCWPPREYISPGTLRQRVRDGRELEPRDDVGALGALRSRNPADRDEAWDDWELQDDAVAAAEEPVAAFLGRSGYWGALPEKLQIAVARSPE